MLDEKIKKLADTIVNYSLNVKKGERVLITYTAGKSSLLVKEILKRIYEKKAISFTKVVDLEVEVINSENNTKERINEIEKRIRFDVDNYDSFITIIYNINDYEPKDIDADMRKLLGEKTIDERQIKTNERKWVLLQYPSELDAYKAKMKINEFEKYAFNAMTVDYSKYKKMIRPLKKLIEKTDKVRLTGRDTDITFSIKDIPVVECIGNMNIPDGEIYTAPVKRSVNGYITYNTPSPYQGNVFHNVRLELKDGKIIKATSDEGSLDHIFDTDEGARYIGEFAIGFNNMIREPMGDILYDEKITGSIHFTPGASYKDAFNGNESSIHWDMVLIQREEYGGGEIYFDDKLVRKDGLFVLDRLKGINPK